MYKKTYASSLIHLLKSSGLRPTRQRLALADLLFGKDEKGEFRHISAESLHEEATHYGIHVSLATVYNTLHQFTKAGLLREILINAGRSYFDTNTNPHHHFYCENSGALVDIPADKVNVSNLPLPPENHQIASVDVVIRLKQNSAS